MQAAEGIGKAPTKLEQTDPSLTDHVQALHEAGVMPVREIARIAGVSERTLYKYAQKGGWRRRYRSIAKGAGGRFIRREDAGLPFPRGLKALDPAGAARAAQACVQAGEMSDTALKRAQAVMDAEADARSLALLVRAMRDLAALSGKTKAAPKKRRARDASEGDGDGDGEELRRELARRIENHARGRGAASPPAASPPPAAPPPSVTQRDEPLSERDRRINDIAARFLARRSSD